MTQGFVNRTNEQRDIQPVAIIAIDPITRIAKALTRIRTEIEIDCRFPVGGMYVIPAIGDQWYVDRYDMLWRLHSRIPFNDNNILIEPQAGQMILGGTGPLELNGSHVNVHGDTNVNGNLGVGSVTLRDEDGVLQQSPDGGATWEPVGSGGTFVEGSASGVPTELELWTGTQAEYEALGSWPATTVYIVVDA
jgi:hypothetical protein